LLLPTMPPCCPPRPARRPEERAAAPKQQPVEDCLGCKVTGLMLGLGGGGFLSSRLFVHPYPTGAHKATIIASAAALFALGVGRVLL
jgi:hypothetical protein